MAYNLGSIATAPAAMQPNNVGNVCNSIAALTDTTTAAGMQHLQQQQQQRQQQQQQCNVYSGEARATATAAATAAAIQQLQAHQQRQYEAFERYRIAAAGSAMAEVGSAMQCFAASTAGRATLAAAEENFTRAAAATARAMQYLEEEQLQQQQLQEEERIEQQIEQQKQNMRALATAWKHEANQLQDLFNAKRAVQAVQVQAVQVQAVHDERALCTSLLMRACGIARISQCDFETAKEYGSEQQIKALADELETANAWVDFYREKLQELEINGGSVRG
jgi:hypothetical protein